MMKELHESLFESDIDSAQDLLNDGADINAEYGIGIYPIISAINSDNPKVLLFAIQSGADVNIEYGLPLREAIDYCIDGMIQNQRETLYPEALEMIRILIHYKADLEILDENNSRPIDIISKYSKAGLDFDKLKNLFRPVIPNIDELLNLQTKSDIN